MADDLPNIAEVLGAVFARVSEAERPLLLAAAERLAAERYRGWADEHPDPNATRGLRACAEREDAIAARVEALVPDAEARTRAIFEKLPELPDLNRSLFAGRPLIDQFTMQASGERAGASTWEAFAAQSDDPGLSEAYRENIALELENAEFLDRLLSHEG